MSASHARAEAPRRGPLVAVGFGVFSDSHGLAGYAAELVAGMRVAPAVAVLARAGLVLSTGGAGDRALEANDTVNTLGGALRFWPLPSLPVYVQPHVSYLSYTVQYDCAVMGPCWGGSTGGLAGGLDLGVDLARGSHVGLTAALGADVGRWDDYFDGRTRTEPLFRATLSLSFF